jgi:signal transduction histidine kinase
MKPPELRDTGSSSPGRLALRRRGPLVTAMVVGFGLLVALWLAAGFNLLWRFDTVDREVSALTDRVLRSEQALEAVRTSILLGAIDWRDALLDSASGAASESYIDRIRRHRETCAASLADLRHRGEGAATGVALAELAREVDEYWASILPIMATAPMQRPADIQRIMRDRVIPKRANVERIVAQAQSIIRLELQQQQARKVDVYARSRVRFMLTGGLALLLSLGVGWFGTRHVGRLERALGTQVTVNAQHVADLHRLSGRLVRAQEDERRLIARELHDEVGQALTAVRVQLSFARRSVPPQEMAAIDQCRGVVDAALQSARQLSRLLRPPMLDDMGLGPALAAYLSAFEERTGITTDLVHAGLDDRPDPAVEICIFRIVQEATTNIARHAQATSCRVYLQRLPGSAVLSVEDNGQGFDPHTQPPGTEAGIGLVGIRERVADARGTFRIESAPGRGTQLSVELPAPRRTTAESLHVDADPADETPEEEVADGPDTARG